MAAKQALENLAEVASPHMGKQIRQILQGRISTLDAEHILSEALIANSAPLPEHVLLAADKAWQAAKEADTDGPPAVTTGQDLLQRRPAAAAGNATIFRDGDDGCTTMAWRGDITTLAVDAVVNPCNEAGLGCFAPEHRCLDNTIHRRAGPRLREACRAALAGRDDTHAPLACGAPPIVTPGFRLPAHNVIHVTGPQLRRGTSRASLKQKAALAQAYVSCLRAAAASGLRSVAFCCISSGLYGFPAKDASATALEAVHAWLDDEAKQTSHSLELIVFCTYSEGDHEMYTGLGPRHRAPGSARGRLGDLLQPDLANQDEILAAAKWLADADAVLVCAGAGMSINNTSPDNVYQRPEDFVHRYPDMPARGYRTAYECMGLSQDPMLTAGEKMGFLVRHVENMGYNFQPGPAYTTVQKLLDGKNWFVWTSNVDSMFEKSGLDPTRYEEEDFQCCTELGASVLAILRAALPLPPLQRARGRFGDPRRRCSKCPPHGPAPLARALSVCCC